MRINAGDYKFRKIELPADIRLGLELLSRGAGHCRFNDCSRKHVAIVQENIDHCKANDKATVSTMDFRKCLDSLHEKMDLIILDPPYRAGYYEEAIEKIMENDLLAEGRTSVRRNPSGGDCRSEKDERKKVRNHWSGYLHKSLKWLHSLLYFDRIN